MLVGLPSPSSRGQLYAAETEPNRCRFLLSFNVQSLPYRRGNADGFKEAICWIYQKASEQVAFVQLHCPSPTPLIELTTMSCRLGHITAHQLRQMSGKRDEESFRAIR